MHHSLIRDSSAWDATVITEFLRNSRIPVRLAAVSASGSPLICSLWYAYADGAIWCATQRDAYFAGLLRNNPLCGFEVAADSLPYRGVRGQGRASLSDTAGPDTLAQLIDRYLENRESSLAQWLLARKTDEVAIRIEPVWLTAWDYSQRMSDATAA